MLESEDVVEALPSMNSNVEQGDCQYWVGSLVLVMGVESPPRLACLKRLGCLPSSSFHRSSKGFSLPHFSPPPASATVSFYGTNLECIVLIHTLPVHTPHLLG